MRSLETIAYEISKCWPKPYFGEVPYIQAMKQLTTLEDKIMADDGRYVVNYFLANAGGWKGDDARRIKAELKAMLKVKR